LQRLVKNKWLWFALAGGAFVALRLYYLFAIGPESLNQDEAALLMNARFIEGSGVDEWGQMWPVVFRSFGDAKLPGYVYLVSVLVKFFGSSDWLVRVPAVVAGVFMPVLLYLNARVITRSPMAALTAAFLFLLSPWSWHYGTIGFEANLGLVLFLVGSFLVLRKPHTWLGDGVAGLFFLLAAVTYNTPWI